MPRAGAEGPRFFGKVGERVLFGKREPDNKHSLVTRAMMRMVDPAAARRELDRPLKRKGSEPTRESTHSAGISKTPELVDVKAESPAVRLSSVLESWSPPKEEATTTEGKAAQRAGAMTFLRKFRAIGMELTQVESFNGKVSKPGKENDSIHMHSNGRALSIRHVKVTPGETTPPALVHEIELASINGINGEITKASVNIRTPRVNIPLGIDLTQKADPTLSTVIDITRAVHTTGEVLLRYLRLATR